MRVDDGRWTMDRAKIAPFRNRRLSSLGLAALFDNETNPWRASFANEEPAQDLVEYWLY